VAEPVWSDDPFFDIAEHVREAPPGARLQEIADDFLSRPLDRGRPLWEILVVPRIGASGPPRAALLGKVHHAMVDGIAAVELGMLLFDVAAEPESAEPVGWTPAPADGTMRLAAEAVVDTALTQFRAAGRAFALGRSPARTVRVADTLRRAALSLAEDTIRPAPDSAYNVAIGPRRTLVPHAVSLPRLLALKETFGVTLNDVVLATCAGALRRFAQRRGEEPADLRIMVPVNVRDRSDAASATGNDITFAFVELPVALPTARERLNTIVARMDELKGSGKIAGTSALLQGLGALPEPLKDRAARLAASPRLYNLTISNVPGPRIPLYAAGARVRSIVPVIPVPDRHALSIGVLTYDGQAHFGFYADPAALSRTGALPLTVEESVTELEIAAGRAISAPGDRRARSRGSAATLRSGPRRSARGPSRSWPS
jgi:diacylglycerol O-acyltransferase / wax synthase